MYLVMGFFHFTSLSIFWNDDQAKLNHIIWVKQNGENQTGGSFEENKSSWCHWKPTDCNKASNLPWGKKITYRRQSTKRDYSNNLQRPDISEAKHEHSECTKKVTRSRNWSQIFITSNTEQSSRLVLLHRCTNLNVQSRLDSLTATRTAWWMVHIRQ